MFKKKPIKEALAEPADVIESESLAAAEDKKDATKKEIEPALLQTDGLPLLEMRNAWYRDQYRKAVNLNLLLGASLIFAIAFAYYIYQDKPLPSYFATTQDGKLLPLTPLNEPNLSRKTVSQWAVTALIETFDFHWQNVAPSLAKSCDAYYTTVGCESLVSALKDAQTIDAVTNKQLIVSLAITETPVITNAGVDTDGKYFWILQLPSIMTFRSGNETQSAKQLFTLKIKRISTLARPEGIGIVQVIAQQQ